MIRLILTIAASVLFASCCTKVKCPTPRPGFKLIGFSEEDVDTVYQSVDGGESEKLHIQLLEDTSYAVSINVRDDAKINTVVISIPGADKQYTLSNFSYGVEDCNTCFPVRLSKERYINGFEVNGHHYTGNVAIDVYK